MFEKRIKELSKKLGEDSINLFYVLTHKKHRREVYFRNIDEAVNFMRIKFNSPMKRVLYFLIKIRILQPFLKKIYLSKKMGDVIFVANNIKCFDLKKKTVLSLLKRYEWKDDFLNSARLRNNISKEGYAPIIFEINSRVPFSVEELLKQYEGNDDMRVFERIYSWYKKRGIKKINTKKYVSSLKRNILEMGINNIFVLNLLDNLSKFSKDLLVSELHGAFSKEQVLNKYGKYVFVDWSRDKGFNRDLVIRDLVSYFREEQDLLENSKFLELLKIYPKEVRKNISLYLILNELSSIARRGLEELPLIRLKKLIKKI
jgi:hypothetical protein